MDERKRIRQEVRAAAEELTAAQAELDRLMVRQAAYRSSRHRYGRVALSEGFEQFAPARTAPWHTHQEAEHWKRRRSGDYTVEHERYARARERLFNAEFEAGIARLQAGDAVGAEYAVAYIEADPWHFHSGYLKEKLARWLRRVPLTEGHRERLRNAVVAAIQKGRREDLREYVSLGRKLDSASWRRSLTVLAKTADEETAYRAQRMLDACRLNDVAETEDGRR